MALQTNKPALTTAQLALSACADLASAHYNAMKGMFETQIILFPLIGVNAFGFTSAQMQTGLGADKNEFIGFYTRLLQAIATAMPSFPTDVWAAQTNIRPWFALLSVSIPPGF